MSSQFDLNSAGLGFVLGVMFMFLAAVWIETKVNK